MQFEIRHSISGRIRLRIPALKDNEALSGMLTQWLESQPGVSGVRIKQACCSVVVNYRESTHEDLPWLRTLAGITPHEFFDASEVLFDLDRIIVGPRGNPEFVNLPRKFNVTVTGCTANCTHNESQDLALVPARKDSRFGFNVLVGGKMGSGGFTVLPAAPVPGLFW